MKRSRTLAASNESDFGSVFLVQNGGTRRSAARTKLRQYSTAADYQIMHGQGSADLGLSHLLGAIEMILANQRAK